MNAIRWHRLAAWLLLAISSLLFFPAREIRVDAATPREGEISTRTYIAPITFEVLKSRSELEKEQEQARAKVAAVFEFNHDETNRILEQFDATIAQISRFGALQTEIASRSPEEIVKAEKIREAAELFQDLSRRLSTTVIHQLSQNVRARDSLSTFFHRMMQNGISNVLIASNQRQITLYKELYNLGDVKSMVYGRPDAVLVKDNREQRLDVTQLRPREAVVEETFGALQLAFPHSQALQSAFFEILYAHSAPNIFPLEKLTKKRQQQEAEKVNPAKVIVVKGMEIITAGSIVNRETVEKLEALRLALLKEDSSHGRLFARIGQKVMLLTVSTLFALALFGNRRIRGPRELWTATSATIFQFILFAFSGMAMRALQSGEAGVLPEALDLQLATPFHLGPILMTVFFDFRMGILASALAAFWYGVLAGQDLTAALLAFTTCLGTCWFLNHIRYRSQFLLALAGSIGTGTCLLLVDLMLRNRLETQILLPNLSALAAGAAISLGLSSLILIQIFERFSGITTDLTLVELTDFNNRLLKKLSVDSPSSFHHSIMVSNLAEHAAMRIDANPLLARVMGLYHDIGKTTNSKFFTENQNKGINPHDSLSPWESATIIKDHVSGGLRLAREYNLPALVAAGIPEHHGDNVIHYFYRKAKDQHPDRDIRLDDFRYDGPRPRSKETAILMIADGVEAASRALDNPTPERLAKVVRDTIQTRLHENQFSNCDLTMRDLEEIQVGLLQALEGVYHTRIQYPAGVFLSER